MKHLVYVLVISFWVLGLYTTLSYSVASLNDVRNVLARFIPAEVAGVPLEDIHHFNSFDREKWVKEKAESLPRGAKVLDVGAGSCPYKKYFSHCSYETHDFACNIDHVNYCDLNYVSDVTAIPVPDKSYDAVLCTEVLEHVPEPIAALKEMARVLKSGGRLFLTAPLGSGLHQLPYHFYGGYTPEWYKLFCAKNGLVIAEITENGGFFKLLAQECARVSWTFDQHKELHGKNAELIRWLFHEVWPRYLFSLDAKAPIKAFTVGYHVEAVKPARVGVCVTATGRYVHDFLLPFLESCRKYFLKRHKITYFVFTDQTIEPQSDVIVVPIVHEPWPFVTLKRFEYYARAREQLMQMDYVFASDADMRFVADAGEEMFGSLIATRHPEHLDGDRQRYNYESRHPESTAYIAPHEGMYYFAGGFYGGTAAEFVRLIETLSRAINTDLAQNFIALNHDESHINRYFIDTVPTRILSASYCYPESVSLPVPKILLALDKQHSLYRGAL